ncbi:MAG: tetratricopeptide repeat protein [Longimicrobiales bacterium]
MTQPVASESGGVRRLSAIMFTDMVGYTALVQDDEVRARRLRDRWRTVLERTIAEQHGQLLQTYGDGSLSVFDSAIAAVTCAVAIQRALREDPAIPLRIGIHTGDVVHDRDGVFGDGVNVAARMQSLAAPGSVLVSEKVYDEIKNQPSLAAVSMGRFDLKNVRRPMEVYAILAPGVVRPTRDALAGRPHEERRSIAVLPFVNMSADPGNEFFSDGITEELINALARVNGVQVTARTSSFAFKGKNDDVREIAAKLGVNTVLEGSVRKAGERVRITAQLIDASSGYHLFSDTYNQRLDDVFEAQDAIVKAIMSAVQDRLVPQQRIESPAVTRSDPKVHGAYLRGLADYNRWTPDHLRSAIRHFDAAIRIDPDFAPAHAGLAGSYLVLASYGHMPAAHAYTKSEQAAMRAAELDPENGDAHANIGLVRLFADWDFEAAYAELQKAVGMSPGAARVRHALAVYLIAAGEADRAVEEMEIATQLDPLSPLMVNMLGTALLYAGRPGDAIAAHDRAIELDPTFRAALDEQGWALITQGRLEEAAHVFERVLEITGDPYKGVANRGYVHAMLGRTREARQALAMLKERAGRNPDQWLHVDFMILHFALGDMKEAGKHFEAMIAERSTEALFMPHNPAYIEVLKVPAVQEILERHGLDRFARGDITAIPPRTSGGP